VSSVRDGLNTGSQHLPEGKRE